MSQKETTEGLKTLVSESNDPVILQTADDTTDHSS
jgi:hypothetical protein